MKLYWHPAMQFMYKIVLVLNTASLARQFQPLPGDFGSRDFGMLFRPAISTRDFGPGPYLRFRNPPSGRAQGDLPRPSRIQTRDPRLNSPLAPAGLLTFFTISILADFFIFLEHKINFKSFLGL
jgi:hypothetical protein